MAGSIDAGALDGADAVVHLAGAGIGDKRWSAPRRREIVSSRVQATTLLARTLAGLDRPPAVLVSASAVGYYGDRGDEELTEDSTGGPGSWPRCAGPGRTPPVPAADAGVRVVPAALGRRAVGSRGRAGAPAPALFRSGSAAGLGNGRQWLSWITLADEVGAILHALDRARPRGAGQRHRADAGDQPRLHARPGPGAASTGGPGRPGLRAPGRAGVRLRHRRWCSPASVSSPPGCASAGYAFDHPDIDTALSAVLAPRRPAVRRLHRSGSVAVRPRPGARFSTTSARSSPPGSRARTGMVTPLST